MGLDLVFFLLDICLHRNFILEYISVKILKIKRMKISNSIFSSFNPDYLTSLFIDNTIFILKIMCYIVSVLILWREPTHGEINTGGQETYTRTLA